MTTLRLQNSRQEELRRQVCKGNDIQSYNKAPNWYWPVKLQKRSNQSQ